MEARGHFEKGFYIVIQYISNYGARKYLYKTEEQRDSALAKLIALRGVVRTAGQFYL